jgi:hypothetical protein
VRVRSIQNSRPIPASSAASAVAKRGRVIPQSPPGEARVKTNKEHSMKLSNVSIHGWLACATALLGLSAGAAAQGLVSTAGVLVATDGDAVPDANGRRSRTSRSPASARWATTP